LGIKLSELEVDSRLTLVVSANGNQMIMDAYIKRVVNNQIAIIGIEYETTRTLNFDNVHIEVECSLDGGVPFWWKEANVIFYRNEYVLQVSGEGVKHNRRQYFRVPVSKKANMYVDGRGMTSVMVKDVSLTGFALTDRVKELGLNIGVRVTIRFEDYGYNLELVGDLVRKEEKEDMDIYGFKICNLCKDLPTYISFRQRKKG